MKLTAILLACCLAVTVAWSDEDEHRVREKAIKECLQEKKLTEDEARNPSNLGCMFACMHKKVGYLNSDGTLNIDRITYGNANPRFRELARRVCQECVKNAKGDACQLSLCLENAKVE